MEEAVFIKLLVVGNSGVGKTSILNQYCAGNYDTNVAPTIGCDFSYKLVTSSSGKNIRLQLWDISGQDRFHSVSKLYVRGASGCIVVCDITSIDTLNSAIKWKNIIEENCDIIEGETIPLILVQNKVDLLNKMDQIEPFQTIEFLTDFAINNKFIGAYQVSAKNDINLKQTVDLLLKKITEKNFFRAKSSTMKDNFNDDQKINEFRKENKNNEQLKLNNKSYKDIRLSYIECNMPIPQLYVSKSIEH